MKAYKSGPNALLEAGNILEVIAIKKDSLKRDLINKEEKVESILSVLDELYPHPKTALNHNNPFELLVSTILSAQCTDVRVNKVTERLFSLYKTPEHFINLGQDALAEHIRECGFFKNKSKNIIKTCEKLKNEYASKVPNTMEELMKLPGVGRKTANVILSNAFGKDAIAVDTHVFRVSRRLGLAFNDTPEKVEEELMMAIPKSKWSLVHHQLIYHGRQVCKARKPKCDICLLRPFCNYGSQ